MQRISSTPSSALPGTDASAIALLSELTDNSAGARLSEGNEKASGSSTEAIAAGKGGAGGGAGGEVGGGGEVEVGQEELEEYGSRMREERFLSRTKILRDLYS